MQSRGVAIRAFDVHRRSSYLARGAAFSPILAAQQEGQRSMRRHHRSLFVVGRRRIGRLLKITEFLAHDLSSFADWPLLIGVTIFRPSLSPLFFGARATRISPSWLAKMIDLSENWLTGEQHRFLCHGRQPTFSFRHRVVGVFFSASWNLFVKAAPLLVSSRPLVRGRTAPSLKVERARSLALFLSLSLQRLTRTWQGITRLCLYGDQKKKKQC